MAVGARQTDILQQFLIEAVLVCLIGGALGIGSALGFGAVFNAFDVGFRLDLFDDVDCRRGRFLNRDRRCIRLHAGAQRVAARSGGGVVTGIDCVMLDGVENRMKNSDERTTQRLFPGARVRMSRLGLERHPKYGDREGVIVGRGSPSGWRVKFDARKTVEAIHQDYLELAAQPGAAARQAAQQRGRN